jgi:hypothetical protein
VRVRLFFQSHHKGHRQHGKNEAGPKQSLITLGETLGFQNALGPNRSSESQNASQKLNGPEKPTSGLGKRFGDEVAVYRPNESCCDGVQAKGDKKDHKDSSVRQYINQRRTDRNRENTHPFCDHNKQEKGLTPGSSHDQMSANQLGQIAANCEGGSD